MHRVLLLSVCLFFVLSVSGQGVPTGFDLSNYGVRIDPEKRLIVVLAALESATTKNAAGADEKLLNTPLSEKSTKFRAQLAADLATTPSELRQRISTFVIQYKKRHPNMSDAALIEPFISMAYSLTPVPELGDPVITNDLPGALLDVLDFAPLVREFYRRSPIASKLDDYSKDYIAESDTVLRTSAREMVKELLDYMHTRPKLTFTEKIKVETQKDKSKSTALTKTEIREHERKFYIVPERLAPKGNVNFLNIRDDYYVIVPPDTDLSVSEARRAFLRFVIDPLIMANSNEVATMREWVRPQLEERRKSNPDISLDPFLAITRSLVAAVDTREAEFERARVATDVARERIGRLTKVEDKEKLAKDLERFKQELSDEATLRLYEDYEKGAVLSLYFAEQLKGIEESGFDLGASLREMVAAFDPAKATEKIASSVDARKRALAAREERKKNPQKNVIAADNPVTTRLLQIQKTITAKDYQQANADLKRLLAEYPSEPRIYFSIGRVASLSAVGVEDPEVRAQKLLEAKTAYSNVIRTATPTTDRALLSLTYVALGRIYEFEDRPDYALKLYDKAIELDEVPLGGYQEALAAKQRLLKPQ